LTVALVSCESAPANPKEVHQNSAIPDQQVSAIVDDLARTDVPAWTERVRGLEESLRLAVKHELGRRAIAIGEQLTDDREPKEFEAIRVLFGKAGGQLEGFTDFIVWVSAHQGRQGFQTIWGIGVKAFPSVFQLRQDRHYNTSKLIGKLVLEYALGSFRGKAHTDATVVDFCTGELTRCPPELRPHYRSILAALGDKECLDAIPTLLKSKLIADWQYGHWLIEMMFKSAAPYGEFELLHVHGEDTSSDSGGKLWPPVNEKTMTWWKENRGRMTFDPKKVAWVLVGK
jgi:hypothetical protein